MPDPYLTKLAADEATLAESLAELLVARRHYLEFLKTLKGAPEPTGISASVPVRVSPVGPVLSNAPSDDSLEIPAHLDRRARA